MHAFSQKHFKSGFTAKSALLFTNTLVSYPDLGSSPSPDGLATQVQKLVLMGGVMSVLIEVTKILQALNAV